MSILNAVLFQVHLLTGEFNTPFTLYGFTTVCKAPKGDTAIR